MNEVIQKAAQGAGYIGSGVFAGLTLADIELVVRIAVGVMTIVALGVGIWLKIRAARKQ